MVSRSLTALSAAATIVALTTPTAFVEAHQRVYLPEVVYTVADRGTNWGPQAKLESQGYKTTKDFNAYLKANNYKTLREFMDKDGAYKPNKGATVECGYTDPNAPAQPIPKNGDFRTSGYTHEGPCEIWIDDVMIKHGDNCHFDIADTTFTDKIDYSACKGKCMLKWYWLGIRPMGKKYSWQIYKACIPLAGTGGGSSGAATTSAPAKATTAPAKATTAPAKATTAPAKATTAPAKATPAPAKDDAETGNDDDGAATPVTTKPATAKPAPATPATSKPADAAPAVTKPAVTTKAPETAGEAKKPAKCGRRRD